MKTRKTKVELVQELVDFITSDEVIKTQKELFALWSNNTINYGAYLVHNSHDWYCAEKTMEFIHKANNSSSFSNYVKNAKETTFTFTYWLQECHKNQERAKTFIEKVKQHVKQGTTMPGMCADPSTHRE